MGDHLFQAFLRAMPDRQAPFLLAGRDCSAMSFGGMLDRTAQYANLLAEIGIQPGERVVVQAEKCLQSLLFYLACLRAGAVYLPLNTAYTQAEIDYFIEDGQPSLIVCDPKSEPSLAGRGIPVLTLDAQGKGSLAQQADAQADRCEDLALGSDDLAAILYTSGTTGRSKGAMLTHGNLLSNARTLAECWRFTSNDVLLHALPIYHAHGLFVAVNTVLVSGASMILHARFDPAHVLEDMKRASVMMGVPTFYTRLLDRNDLTKDAAAHMRLFISGSAPLLAETHRQWRQRTGHEILERYGLTETLMNSSNPYDGERRAGSVGHPLPGISLRIVGQDDARPLGNGEIGVIEVKGPNVCKGYWRNEEKTRTEFRKDGYFITGDLGCFDEDGYLRIVGRAKDLVITGGFNVYPKEVEDEIDALEGVAESAVFGVPHPDFGESVTAAVVLEPGAALDENDILAGLAGRLAKFKQPKRICFMPELPRNGMGKVQKNVLRERFNALHGFGAAP